MATPGRKPLTGGRVSTLGGPWGLLLGILVFSLFYALHLRGQHLPHYLSEMFVVVVAVGVFMLTWNGRRFLDNHFFLFLGISYLFVGVIDGLHALAFDGWIGGKENIDIQFWYAARYFQAASFVTALLFVVRKFRPGVALAVLSAVAASLVGAISGGMFHGWFDHAAHPWFMGMNDLALFGLGAAAYAMLRRKREHFDRELLDCLSLSILIAVLSGVAEGLGMRGYAKLFLLGDLFLALSFYLVYKAVIQTGLVEQRVVVVVGRADREPRVVDDPDFGVDVHRRARHPRRPRIERGGEEAFAARVRSGEHGELPARAVLARVGARGQQHDEAEPV